MSLLSNPDITSCQELYLPSPGRDAYRTSVRNYLSVVGSYEHQSYDYKRAVEMLNEQLRLGLDQTDIQAFALMFTGLAQSKRFGEDQFIEPWLGENSSVHSIHCALLMTDQFDAAGLLHPDRQNSEIIDLRLKMTLGCLIHDMGEILGEFSSLSQRANDTSRHEIPEVERRIFKDTLKLAYWAVQEGTPERFLQMVTELKRKACVGKGNSSLRQVNQALAEFEDRVTDRLFITDSIKLRVDNLVKLYDVVELSDKSNASTRDKFVAYGVKVCEHVQGTRHLNRFSTKHEGHRSVNEFSTPTFDSTFEHRLQELVTERGRTTLPGDLTHSARIKKNMEYVEAGIPEMFECADDEPTLRLAKRLRNTTYETMIEYANGHIYLFDRRLVDAPLEVINKFRMIWKGDLSKSEIEQLLDQARELLEAERARMLSELRKQAQASAPKHDLTETSDQPGRYETLGEIVSKCQIMSLYLAAIKNDYIPKSGSRPLGLQDQIPEELKPLPRTPWHERRGRKRLGGAV